MTKTASEGSAYAPRPTTHPEKPYDLSLTATTLRIGDCATLAKHYQDSKSWEEVRRRVVEDDVLMLRSVPSRKRIAYDLIKRLRHLTSAEFELLLETPDANVQRAVTWLSVCRTYPFIADSMQGLIARRKASGADKLTEGAYHSYLEEESLLHPELLEGTERTLKKRRTQYFHMLREIGFIAKDGTLLPYLLPPTCTNVIAQNDLRFFPTLV